MSNPVTYEELGPRDQVLIDEAGGGNQTVVSARMVKALNGNGNAAIMLSQLLFWSRTKADEQGWFFRTRQQMEARCGLGKKAQKNAAETLSNLGLVETDLRGMPARKHYRILLGEVICLLAESEPDRAHGSNQDRAHEVKQDRAHANGSYYRQDTESNNNSTGAREEESVQAYEETFPRQLKQSQAEKVAHKVDDMDLWRAVLEWWDMNGYRAKSVGRMLNKYRQTDSPDDLYQDRKNGRSANGEPVEYNARGYRIQ